MSYEGRVYRLCDRGHVTCFNAHDGHYYGNPINEQKCCQCGTTNFVGDIEVDDTNCDAIANAYFELVTPEETKTCNCCGVTRVSVPATYRIVLCEKYGSFEFDHLVPLEGYNMD